MTNENVAVGCPPLTISTAIALLLDRQSQHGGDTPLEALNEDGDFVCVRGIAIGRYANGAPFAYVETD